MPYPPPRTEDHIFQGDMNSDLADELLEKTSVRIFLNCGVLSTTGGNMGSVTNRMGNTLITTPLPSGTNKTIGTKADERNNKFYFLVYNSNGFHTWFVYDEIKNTIVPFLTNLTDTDNVDIMRLSLNNPVLHIELVIGTNQVTGQENVLIYWCDALNKGRKTNIQKCLDKTVTGYGYRITEDFITAYKICPVYAPVVANSTTAAGVTGYWTDLTQDSNYLYGQLFKFCYWYIYDDGEVSNPSDWSRVALPPNQSYEGQGYVTNTNAVTGQVTTDNNCIAVGINTGSPLVVKIVIAMQTTGSVLTNGVTTKGAFLDWQICAILNKDELGLSDNAQISYNFYNTGSSIAADQTKINRPFSFMFRVPTCIAFTGLCMTQTGGYEGFPRVPINISVLNTPQPLFLPSGTENVLNNPSISVTRTAYTVNTSLFTVNRYNPTTEFIIGADVKKGNVFTIIGTTPNDTAENILLGQIGALGGAQQYSFSYTAKLSDTAISVANQIKAYLRGIGRGKPDPHNGISGESESGGNATFFYSYLGQYDKGMTVFSGSVTKVQYAELVNDGLSVQVKKSGCIEQYAIGYEDDDGRKSNAYTNASCVIRTPFLTEAPGGVLQQPIHTVSIMHQPPVWARRWILYRTPDVSNFIQILIQQVIDVVVINSIANGEYLDLVIGSLFTYQQIHPDVVTAYQFTPGDRVRLIRNENTGVYYTPNTDGSPGVYETAALSYNEVTTELRNAQITTYGTDHVTPADGVITDYVGKNIQIAGYERTIINISGGDYILDGILNIGPTLATIIEPNYTFIDRRGIVRISKPPATINFVSLSTIELYTPPVTTNNLDYLLFNDTAQKFDIINFGTDTRAHAGTHQNQDGTSLSTLLSTPAIVLTEEGDAYIRNRELPTNTSLIDTQIIVDSIEDPAFCDFYPSTLNNLGRVYPMDQGTGQNYFGSRTRFSNSYIVDTAINGLNDFNDLDRQDFNDANGDVKLTKVKENWLMIYKQLKTGKIPLNQSIISTTTGAQFIGTSDQLLGPIQYFEEINGGIGDNPESWGESDKFFYFASPQLGLFLQQSVSGIRPISKLFGWDFQSRSILAQVKKYVLKIPFGFDKPNDNVWWSIPQYIPSIFNNPINASDWNTFSSAIPSGATPNILTQPANGTVDYNGTTGLFEVNMDTDFIGNDSFTYNYALSGGGYTNTVNVCITCSAPPVSQIGYEGLSSSKICTKILVSGSYVNDGNELETILQGYYLGTTNLTGFIMPNIQNISPQAIVPSTSDITYNETTTPTPTGGSNLDVWYNAPNDTLYQNISGTWTLLTNRLINQFYLAPVQNLTDCPLPAPPAGSTININNTTSDFTINFVRVDLGSTLIYSKTSIGPGGSISDSLPSGTYTVNVKILPSTDGGTGVLSISSNGTITTYPVSYSGTDVSQTGVVAPIIVQLDV